MTDVTRLRFREAALADVEAAALWYACDAGVAVADRFLAALAAVYARIARQPGAGSPRWGQMLGVPGLRSMATARFPWFVFYIEDDDHIEIWRVLHGSRDIPASLTEQGIEDDHREGQ